GVDRRALLASETLRGAIVWRFQPSGFFAPTGGTAQRLPNGNVLVPSTRGGRVFEVTAAGALVWEWVPPYEPVRAERVGADACPQLAAPAPRAAAPPPAAWPPP